MTSVKITLKCRIPQCQASTTWEDEPPTVTPEGQWSVTRRAPPAGWRLVKPVPRTNEGFEGPVPYKGRSMEQGAGFCPQHAPGEAQHGRTLP